MNVDDITSANMTTSARSHTHVEATGHLGKRRKMEEEEPRMPPAPTERLEPAAAERSTQLWFERGDVVFRTADVAFKVHSDILGHHSEVFRELLSGPARDLRRDEVLDGCPVVRTGDDSVYMSKLLELIYGGVNSDWFCREMKTIPFAELSRVTMLAAKYRVQSVIGEAVSRLSACFPSRHLRDFNRTLDFTDWPTEPPIDISIVDTVAVIKLAKSLGAPQLLPTAFVIAADLEKKVIVEGVTYGRETVRLDDAELRQLLDGFSKVAEENMTVMKAILEHHPTCRDAAKCQGVLKKLALIAAREGWFASTRALDAIENWFEEGYTEASESDSHSCLQCHQELQRTIAFRREQMWKKLGAIYGVADWPAQ